jgi:hypothetical protein
MTTTTDIALIDFGAGSERRRQEEGVYHKTMNPPSEKHIEHPMERDYGV